MIDFTPPTKILLHPSERGGMGVFCKEKIFQKEIIEICYLYEINSIGIIDFYFLDMNLQHMYFLGDMVVCITTVTPQMLIGKIILVNLGLYFLH